MLRLHMICVGLPWVLIAAPALAVASDPVPEIQRPPAAAQAVGVLHGLRTIPEACARLQGQFTGVASSPYALAAVRTSARCQPRARLLDTALARPSAATGWILNDVIRVPAAACPGQQAVVRVWRQPAAGAVPTMDAQGRARVYLKEGLDAAGAGKLGAIPRYAAVLAMEGQGCR